MGNRVAAWWVFAKMSDYKSIQKNLISNYYNLSFKIIAWNLFLLLIERLKLFVRENTKTDHHIWLLLDIWKPSTKSLNNISKYFSPWGFIKRPCFKTGNSNIVKNSSFLSSENQNIFDPNCAKITKCYNIHNCAHQLSFSRCKTILQNKILLCS